MSSGWEFQLCAGNRTCLSYERYELRISGSTAASMTFTHDNCEAAMILEFGDASGVTAETEPGGILILDQLGLVIGLRSLGLQDLAKSLDHSRIRLFVRLSSPAFSAGDVQYPPRPASVAKSQAIALDAGKSFPLRREASMARLRRRAGVQTLRRDPSHVADEGGAERAMGGGVEGEGRGL